jgi:hypothetical protein
MNMVQAITNLTQVLGMTFTNKNDLNNSGDLLQHNASNQFVDVDEIVHKKYKNVNDEKQKHHICMNYKIILDNAYYKYSFILASSFIYFYELDHVQTHVPFIKLHFNSSNF